eukprot:TRINITY_DN9569_c0_g1_i1.p1 TRINITY_DN9569_c0_g1~~TRINITY_DN9569_c0_g1_i1.p1  ORF type:complete len:184 (+),score=35.00 TRINITY_DN9569_c0_g1_i1:259-810(+)
MKIFFLFLLIFISSISCYSQVYTYPAIYLCSDSNEKLYNITCLYRKGGKFGPLNDCNLKPSYASVFNSFDNSTMLCAIYNNELNQDALVANDSYSIITFVDNSISINYVALFERGQKIVDNIDVYTDLIYVYLGSALVNILSKTTAGNGIDIQYSSTLHTHYRPNPPQNLWIRFDPSYTNNTK